MKIKRNVGKHTPATEARDRILDHLVTHQHYYAGGTSPGLRPSVLGQVAFPDYSFSRRQGAAFSVAKILRALYDEGLARQNDRGWYLTSNGVARAHQLTETDGI